jgi:hypothetical protein
MPGFNKRGPENQGPMTGRKMGNCASNQASNQAGFGRGRGNGRCMRNAQQYMSPQQSVSSKEDLTQRAQDLEKELEAVKQELYHSN